MGEATIRSIAKEARVSIATVSRAVNPHTSRFVKKSTREKVLNIVRRTGYLPSPAAKRLATGKSLNIVVFIGTKYQTIFYSDYYMKLLAGVMQTLEHSEYSLIIRMVKSRESRFDLKKMIRGMDIAGAIICNEPDLLQVSMTSLEGVGIPVVILNRVDKKDGVRFIACDNFKAAYEATKHLVHMGHKKIAMIRGSSLEKDFIDRFEGYKSAILESSLFFNNSYIHTGDFSEGSVVEAIKKFISLPERPTAILCGNDEIAIRAIVNMGRFGLQCPRDISIIGFDGLDIGEYLAPKLTTMKLQVQEMARAAMENIIAALEESKDIGGVQIFDAQLVKGETCAKSAPARVYTKV